MDQMKKGFFMEDNENKNNGNPDGSFVGNVDVKTESSELDKTQVEKLSDAKKTEVPAPSLMRSVIQSLIRYFVSGVVVLLPLVVTTGIVYWLTNYFVQWFGPATTIGKLLSRVGIAFVPGEKLPYLYGWLVVLATLFIIGFLIEVVFRKKVVSWFDALIGKIPLIGTVYGTTRKFTDLMNKSGNEELHNMSPVYCRFGSQGGGVLVLALLPNNRTYKIQGNDYRAVIVPTAPVPFGGGMFFIPVDDIIPADMTIDELMTFYVTMGVQ